MCNFWGGITYNKQFSCTLDQICLSRVHLDMEFELSFSGHASQLAKTQKMLTYSSFAEATLVKLKFLRWPYPLFLPPTTCYSEHLAFWWHNMLLNRQRSSSGCNSKLVSKGPVIHCRVAAVGGGAGGQVSRWGGTSVGRGSTSVGGTSLFGGWVLVPA